MDIIFWADKNKIMAIFRMLQARHKTQLLFSYGKNKEKRQVHLFYLVALSTVSIVIQMGSTINVLGILMGQPNRYTKHKYHTIYLQLLLLINQLITNYLCHIYFYLTANMFAVVFILVLLSNIIVIHYFYKKMK